MVELFIYCYVHVYTLIFVTDSNKMTNKLWQTHHHGAEVWVEQGHGGAHHVGGGVIHIRTKETTQWGWFEDM